MHRNREVATLTLAFRFLASCIPALAEPIGEGAATVQPNSSVNIGERTNAWSAFRRVAGNCPQENPSNPFDCWYTSDVVFGLHSGGTASEKSPAVPTPHQSIGAGGAPQSAEAPLITFSYYNKEAYEHIRKNNLHLRATMDQLLAVGQPDPLVTGGRAVPPFPEGSSVVLTAWWPVSATKGTPAPVWDPESNPPRRMGNGYATWNRTVLIDPSSHDGSETVDIKFAGRSFLNSRRVPLKSFQHMRVDERLATQIGAAFRLRKASVIALGRTVEAGDYLSLVALHIASKGAGDKSWTWMTLWWHDEPMKGPFARDRPEDINIGWKHYLMDFVTDDGQPLKADFESAATFNPWLEARFPDGGQGGGTVSNCVSCHRRASYPPIDFLPIRRGSPDPANDPAFQPGRLRTDFLWSIARSPSSTDRKSR